MTNAKLIQASAHDSPGQTGKYPNGATILTPDNEVTSNIILKRQPEPTAPPQVLHLVPTEIRESILYLLRCDPEWKIEDMSVSHQIYLLNKWLKNVMDEERHCAQ